MNQDRPVWSEIKLDHILHNYQEVQRLIGPKVHIMPIVKANAYGHGALEVAQALAEVGAPYFGVAILAEALKLRERGFAKPLLVLGWTPQEAYEPAIRQRIALTLFSLKEAQALSRTALALQQKACIHIKIDTGMGRIGFIPTEQSIEDIVSLLALPGLEVEGIFTHLAKADEPHREYTKQQTQAFEDFYKEVQARSGFQFKLKHSANSAAIIDHPATHLDLVRPGIMLYGLAPAESLVQKVNLRPALSLRAKVSFVKEVPAGTAISYGGSYVTQSKARIATLPLGYGDGYSRLLSGKAAILFKGRKAPLVGRICMDQMMFDASHLPVKPQQGDIVTLIGEDEGNFISVDELAGFLGTINYEIPCMLSDRVPRIYT